MTLHSIGDLALGFQTRLGNQRLRAEVGTLTQELTTGRQSDPTAATRGDSSVLASVEHGLTALRSYEVAAGEAALFTQAMQNALTAIQETGGDLGPAMLEAGTSGHSTMVAATAADARARLETVIGALNTRIADRAVFAGAGTDGAAIVDRETMLADLAITIAAETTSAGVIAAVEAWFDTPAGGFETSGYIGSDSALSPFRVGEGQSAEMTVTAADQGVRDLLKGYALAALVSEGALGANHAARTEILAEAALQIMAGDATLAGLGAEVGRAEARIEDARTRNAAEATALEIARAEIISADPYSTATALREAESQLEALYAVTARLARLSLTEYLR